MADLENVFGQTGDGDRGVRGETGVWWAIVIAEVTAGAVAIVLFRRGRWKSVRV